MRLGRCWDEDQRLEGRKRADSPTEGVTLCRQEFKTHVAKDRTREGTPSHSSLLRVCLSFLIQDYFCSLFSDCFIWNVWMQWCPTPLLPGQVLASRGFLRGRRCSVWVRQQLCLQFVKGQTHLYVSWAYREHPQDWALLPVVSQQDPGTLLLRAGQHWASREPHGEL